MPQVARVFGNVRQLALLPRRPGFGHPLERAGKRLVVLEHGKLPPFQHEAKKPDTAEHCPQFSIKRAILCLGSVELP
jgi:hypothetical protein